MHRPDQLRDVIPHPAQRSLRAGRGQACGQRRDMLLTEVVFGLFHVQMMASGTGNGEGRNRGA